MAIAIKPSEIDSVDTIGEIDGEEVKLVRTVGGLYLALGRSSKKNNEEVLAAGSHPAIVRYNMEKSYSSFRSSMMKSEGAEPFVVRGMTDLLPKTMVDSGHDLYVINKSIESEVMLTKSNMELVKFKLSKKDGAVEISGPDKMVTNQIKPSVSAVAKTAAIIAIEEGLDTVKHSGKTYSAQQIIEDL